MRKAKASAKSKPAARRRAPHVDIAGLARFFAQQPDVVLAYLFGSVARGQGDHFSDVDVAVLFDARVDAMRRGELRLEYALALGAYANRDVQVVSLASASPVLKMQVLREGRLLYERTPMERITFEVRAAKVYYDTQPLRDFQRKVLFTEGGLSGHR